MEQRIINMLDFLAQRDAFMCYFEEFSREELLNAAKFLAGNTPIIFIANYTM